MPFNGETRQNFKLIASHLEKYVHETLDITVAPKDIIITDYDTGVGDGFQDGITISKQGRGSFHFSGITGDQSRFFLFFQFHGSREWVCSVIRLCEVYH